MRLRSSKEMNSGDTCTICVPPRRRSLQLFLVAEDKEYREEEELQDEGCVSFVCHSSQYLLWLQKYSKIFQKHNFGKVKVFDVWPKFRKELGHFNSYLIVFVLNNLYFCLNHTTLI